MTTAQGSGPRSPLPAPLPPRPVPAIAPTSRPTPRCLPKHGDSAKGVYLTTGDTTAQAIPLDQVHDMALGPQLPNADKPRHPLGRHGARDPRPVDPNAPGPDRALLQLAMKHTAQLPATLAGEKYFIVEGLTDDVINLATNTLAATTYAWDVAVGHPTARKDRVQETEDTLTPDLVNGVVNLTSPPEQHNRKPEGPKVSDWTAFIYSSPDTSTVTLTCDQHTWWVAQWNATGTTDRVHTFRLEAEPPTPVALRNRFKHSTHHTNHPRAHWLALKAAIHWTVDAPATDTTLHKTWLTLTRNLAAYIRKYGTARAERWMSWPTDTEQTLKICTTNLQEHANQLWVCTDHERGKDQHTTYFKTATHRSRPPNWHQNNPGIGRGPVQGERTPRQAGPNSPNRSAATA